MPALAQATMTGPHRLLCSIRRVKPPADDAVEEDCVDRTRRRVPPEVPDDVDDVLLCPVARFIGIGVEGRVTFAREHPHNVRRVAYEREVSDLDASDVGDGFDLSRRQCAYRNSEIA